MRWGMMESMSGMNDSTQRRRSLIRGRRHARRRRPRSTKLVALSGYFPPVLLPTSRRSPRRFIDMLADGTHARSCRRDALSRAARLRACDRRRPAARHSDGALQAGGKFRSAARQRADADPLASRWCRCSCSGSASAISTTILIVFYAATFPMLFNTWTGVRSVNPIWLRAAGAMGADEKRAVLESDRPGRLTVHHHRHAAGVPALVDRGGRRRDDRRVGLGPRLGDLRLQGISADATS